MVEGARLEILCTPCGYRGFKSLPLRQFIENLNIRDVEVFLFLSIGFLQKSVKELGRCGSDVAF